MLTNILLLWIALGVWLAGILIGSAIWCIAGAIEAIERKMK